MKQCEFNKNFNTFRCRIDLSDTDKRNMLDVRRIIRGTIRKVFNEMPGQYFTDSVKIALGNLSESSNKKIKPKFLTQGSFAYNTINTPENPPIQQMDLDDGVYLPLSYVENKSNGNFDQAAQIVRNVIKDCISGMCMSQNWEIERHAKCLRIVINNTTHIDLPVYSMPDNQIKTMQDSFNSSQKDYLDRVDNVLLATDDGWIESDPRDIDDWVKERKKTLGGDFIYYVRYFKAWREFQWSKNESKFSSIMIMAGIAQAMSEYSYRKTNNVALNLLKIATSLSIYLNGNGNGIKHPVKLEKMDEFLSFQQRQEIISKLRVLADNLNIAIDCDDVNKLIACFGIRFPNDSGNCNVTKTTSVVIASAATIRPAKQY